MVSETAEQAPMETATERRKRERTEGRELRVRQAYASAELLEATIHDTEGHASAVGMYYHPAHEAPKEDLARWIRAMKRLGAKIDKEYPKDSESWSSVRVVATWPEGHRFHLLGEVVALVSRAAVCERVVVGRREVTEQVPDPEVVKAAPLVEVTHTVEDVEWQCHSILDAA